MFNERMGIYVENGKSRICPKCGNRFHVFTDYNRHCGGNLFWCECAVCKVTTTTYHHKGIAIAAFKEGLVYSK